MRISDWSSDVCSSDLEPEPSLKYRNRHSRESGNDDQGKTFRTLRPCRHAMTDKFDRRSALKRLGAAGVGLSLPAWLGGCAPPVVRNARARRPNVVFIMTDDHNQSAMGAYGKPNLKTPNLDPIAAQVLRFHLGTRTSPG